ncbi:hypothetical protein WISP_78103 [Willisornis vidua]|uniref:Rna-directed dna polymerase from mobile element jockey-like n=1 Tax=Willisornis vidua TaxID=1566151 RepID=A0ABQ9DA87_9PASS|nr:hypothetical protein WISP_78103 [Willisornis vidua]
MDDGPRLSQCPELEDHDCENEQLSADPELVQNLLVQLDPYKPMGPDGIHHRILKQLTEVIAKHLLIFEWSWESGEVPADWKLANVAPIFKMGKKEDPGNYRSVSLISVLDEGIKCTISKFAYDTKLSGMIDTPERWNVIQRDLDKLKKLMRFNQTKFKVLHLGWATPSINRGWGVGKNANYWN